ncbi:biotin/lipoyl-binding protein [Pseudaquabacterium terrae]|uniref:biotin/lipoyl-binding protein n=1 Tax=Pseudaquabacterium terrae TaxID=2732868 RepID=UPI0031B58879
MSWFSRSKPVAVVVAEVTRGRVESTVANTRAGSIEACQRTKLSTISGGRIELLAVKEGDRVKKGQLLMKLWNDDQQAQQALAQAQLETTRRRVRTPRAARPTRAAAAVPPRRPTCGRPRRGWRSPASSKAARCCGRRLPARWPRSSARSASTPRLSVAGAVLGYGVGHFGAFVIRQLYPAFPAWPPTWAVLAALATALITGILFGVLPAQRAAALDPVAALGRR